MIKKFALAAMFLLTVSAVAAVGQEMPKPELRYVRSDEVTISGGRFRVYTIEITNRSEISDEFFAVSPDLPPCGSNTNASRTWINIYIDGSKRIYGYCAIRSNAELSSLKFSVPADSPQPTEIFVDFVDRREGRQVKSNKVSVE